MSDARSSAWHTMAGPPLAARVGWRNLWRNRRRTALTAGGVAFAIFLVVTSACVQLGSYRTMEETATSLLVGHLQIQSRAYTDDASLESALPDAAVLAERIREVPGVAAVAARLEAFALVSAGERSFGAQVVGIDADAERQVVNFHRQIQRGHGIEGPGDAVLGDGLVRNLGVDAGDEVVILGSGSQGGVAAMVVNVVGIFHTGIDEIDRALLLTDRGGMAAAFGLEGRAHQLVVRTTDLGHVSDVAGSLRETLPTRWPADDGAPLDVRTWSQVLPDLKQAIEVDRMSGRLFYWSIMILVAFSVVNTFIMTVYERTREFGVLLAIGMRPRRIVAMLQWEAVFMWLIGAAGGLLLASALVAFLIRTGIYLGADMERLADQLYLPTRLYPAFTVEALVTAPVVMLAGTQLAALLPSLRVRRLTVADALRTAA